MTKGARRSHCVFCQEELEPMLKVDRVIAQQKRNHRKAEHARMDNYHPKCYDQLKSFIPAIRELLSRQVQKDIYI